MKIQVKKALRSLQVMAPGLQEARFAVHLRILRLLGRPWRPDAGALRYLDVKEPAIIDVGANRGFFIAACLMLLPKARIIGFEPLPILADVLTNRYRDQANVTVYTCALSIKPGRMKIYTPIYRGYTFDPLSSLDYQEAAGWVNSERFYFFNQAKLRVADQAIDVRCLDDFGIRPDVMKIYAQGHEPEVVGGGLRTVREAEPAIMAPARIPRIDACLRDLGYSRYAFRNSRLYPEGEGHTSSWYLKRKHLHLFRCPIEPGSSA